MKKATTILMLAAATGLASCTAQSPKANMKNDVDTLSYMMGISNTQGLKEYAMNQLGIDSAHFADFVKGIEQGTKSTDPKNVAYTAGMQIGQRVGGDMIKMINRQLFGNDSTQSLSKENFLAGFFAALDDKALASIDSASTYVNTKAEEIRTKAIEAQYADYKKENEAFLAENKSKEGVKTTASGLQYKVITEGKGEVPTAESRVKVNYKGTLIDGTEFDAREGMTFSAGHVIKGWTEALTMMPVGSKWELYVPQELAYGSSATGKIKPFSTLIFEIELLEIEK
ncbi:FKBP-type peptidyl-prolyl cis-trans isomerase [Phocaeicola coprophilus]|jgi:FKBP-type peptidyl-prolyl cis-trans isomerase|uniref:FKBP-type peptidyl-prolyl cis-trans isomerase n=1 Tax=Phocaeicola coprophilus TaxID=387090 RepID=UPI0022E15E04|nr:FKBP-type peptidyl-prolyl cis-trans isomerase [Phocaeicola coprophilus]